VEPRRRTRAEPLPALLAAAAALGAGRRDEMTKAINGSQRSAHSSGCCYTHSVSLVLTPPASHYRRRAFVGFGQNKSCTNVKGHLPL